MYTMGSFTFVLWAGRFLFFRLHESPKYLIGQGRYAEAIEVLDAVAKYNGSTNPLTVERLEQVERDHAEYQGSHTNTARADRKLTAWQSIVAFKSGSFYHLKELFSTVKLAYSFTLILLIWGMIGISSPLYSNFLPSILLPMEPRQATIVSALPTGITSL